MLNTKTKSLIAMAIVMVAFAASIYVLPAVADPTLLQDQLQIREQGQQQDRDHKQDLLQTCDSVRSMQRDRLQTLDQDGTQDRLQACDCDGDCNSYQHNYGGDDNNGGSVMQTRRRMQGSSSGKD